MATKDYSHVQQPLNRICQYEGCTKLATVVAVGRDDHNGGGHPEPNVYCETHGQMVEDEGSPEYTHTCPNCGCGQGVN